MTGSPLLDPDREAEWERRRRAEKDGIPMPAEFRLFDDGDAIAVRFPVAVASPLFPRLVPGPQGDSIARHIGALLIGGCFLIALCGRAPLFLALVGGAIVAVWVPLALLGSVRRILTVRPEGVETGWWPIPFSSRRLIHREIVQVFVVPGRGSEADRAAIPTGGSRLLAAYLGTGSIGDRAQFDLCIVRPDGSREVLVGSLRSAEHAFFLERWLERRLGIADAPVPGEAW